MQALLAGLIAGVGTAFACTTFLLVAIHRGLPLPGRLGGAGSLPLPLIGVIAVNGFLFGWTGLGLLLGAGVHALERSRPADGLLSPNLVFTSVVAGSVLLLLGAAAVVRGRIGAPVVASGLAAAIAFGWVLPWLALRGR